jgi:predicted ester cyclase
LLEQIAGWRLETETVAIRGSHLALTRGTYRDATDAAQPITLEALVLMEVDDDNLGRALVLFDPDDINDAFAELMARWIASGEVAHPEVIEAWHGFIVATNRHDFDALAHLSAGATFVNHRQLRASDNIADYMSSMRTLVSLIPDMRIEVAEILTHSATSLVTDIVVKGATAEDIAIEIPAVLLLRFNGDRLGHMEAFDPDQRDLALARFYELNHA